MKLSTSYPLSSSVHTNNAPVFLVSFNTHWVVPVPRAETHLALVIIYIYKAIFQCHMASFVCVVTLCQSVSPCVCRHTSGGANRGEGLCDSVSEGEARKRAAGARIWGP